MKKVTGFTLIELMITVAVIAITAAVGFQSYQRYVLLSSESKAQEAVLDLAQQLQRWKSKTLTYKGFVPREGYDTAPNINVGSDTDPTYEIELVDESTKDPLTSSTANGTAWRAMAVPNASGTAKKGNRYLLLSDGSRCSAAWDDSSLDIDSTCTGNAW